MLARGLVKADDVSAAYGLAYGLTPDEIFGHGEPPLSG
jgi:hypothetical protein